MAAMVDAMFVVIFTYALARDFRLGFKAGRKKACKRPGLESSRHGVSYEISLRAVKNYREPP